MARLQVQLILLIALVFTIVLVHTQDQSGFISIDCGASTAYSDATTKIYYVPDAEYLGTPGTSKDISPSYKTSSLEQQFYNVRSFPDGTKNCYTITPLKVDGGTKYLVRARFMYGNYDLQNHQDQGLEFDIYLGVDYWDTLVFYDASSVVSTEVIYIPSSKFTYICLVNTGKGTPFISVLELRLLDLDSQAYAPVVGSLKLYRRLDMGSNSNNHRYPDDAYDRIWQPYDSDLWTNLTTNEAIDSTGIDTQPPYIVMSTAVTPTVATDNIEFQWESANLDDQYYLYFYFSDFQEMKTNQSREMNIYLNDDLWYDENFTPPYLGITTIYSKYGPTTSSGLFNFFINSTRNSTLPPIINAFEAYTVINFTHTETEQEDVNAMKSIKSAYEVKKNWQGDPCVPQSFSWEGLNCSNDGSNPLNSPRIIFLNLSSSGLTGEISTFLSGLTALQSLDLSCNSLAGTVPDFFSEMASLRVLNLTGNKLTGSLPVGLIERRKQGTLTLSVDGNPDLCVIDTCSTTSKKRNIIVPIVTSLGGLLILIAVAAILWRIKKRKQKGAKDTAVAVETSPEEHRDNISPLITNTKQPNLLRSAKRQFTYMDILRITNNLERVVGKGGFGTVYHGYVDDIQVAVKMLSHSSIQGYRQFQAEAKLLMRVHHRNLTSLVGYCEEGDKLGVIYEYMANGDLRTHLSAKNPRFLSWETRLSIAQDAAQDKFTKLSDNGIMAGLEYLHNGCKPPIIHRDVKSTNILLNESFQAKLSDFGLSRISPIADATPQMPTAVAGTPGYLDPEYWNSQRLSEKSDVFGYGVVLLEIITSQPPISKDNFHLSQSVRNILSTSGDVTSVIDPRLRDNCDINSVWKAVEIAMACVSPSSTKRPKMNQVVNELQLCLAMEKARTNTGNETEPIDSIELASLNINTGMTPLAR